MFLGPRFELRGDGGKDGGYSSRRGSRKSADPRMKYQVGGDFTDVCQLRPKQPKSGENSRQNAPATANSPPKPDNV